MLESIGMTETCAIGMSPTSSKFLFALGMDAIRDHTPELLLLRFEWMPPFPSVWPVSQSAEQAQQELQDIYDLVVPEFTAAEREEIAYDMERQARILLEQAAMVRAPVI